MRVLVHGASLGRGGSRMALAAAGLALRGHDVTWTGGGCPEFPDGPPASLREAGGGLALARFSADLVLGGPEPLGAAVMGWLVRASCMVLGLDGSEPRRWGWAARWAWSTLHAWGLTAEADGEVLRADPAGLDLRQVALWSESEPARVPDAAHADTEILERACERALARHRSRAPRSAVFVDRDGTLVVERGYLSDPADLELLPGTAAALRDIAMAGLPVIVISNQSGVGRGLFPLSRVYEAMARLRGQLREAGVELDGVYFCPHRPEEGCACRKPGTWLLERAADDHDLWLRDSFMVGDKLLDVETAHRVGARGVLVRSGYGREEERVFTQGGTERGPDHVADDLADAAGWILEQEGIGAN
jgi:D-glycero-D-manno-heptose 1,7-bisphosphate phosphatase